MKEEKYKNIKKLNFNDKSLKGDAWLSGFLDLNGNFSIRHTETPKRKITCRLKIEIQKVNDEKNNFINQYILSLIAEVYSGKFFTRKQKSTGKEFFVVILWKKKSLDLLINYLDKNPFYSSKFLDYENWKEIVLLTSKKELYTEKNITKISSTKNTMNSKRTLFNWAHLSLRYFSP